MKKLNRDMKDIKKIQIKFLEMKITTSEMKTTLDGITSKVDMAED